MRLSVLRMAITQPCQILINNNSLDQFFLHGTIRTQKVIEVTMLIRTTGQSLKFIGSKCIQESLIHTTPTRPDYFLFLQESQAKVLTSQSTHLFQNKNKRPRCIKVGNGPLKYSLCEKYLQLSADHHAEWPLCKLWTLCFSVPDLVFPPPPLK